VDPLPDGFSRNAQELRSIPSRQDIANDVEGCLRLAGLVPAMAIKSIFPVFPILTINQLLFHRLNLNMFRGQGVTIRFIRE
jgi:hypothetical protein